jgi:four helix bundle protein
MDAYKPVQGGTMDGIRRFEDLIAWQKARVLTRTVYVVSGEGAFARDFGLRDQIRRASVSVMSNIAEGFERRGRGEFHQALVIAKASCAEVRSLLYVSTDVGYISLETFRSLASETEEVSRILGGLKSSVGRQRRASKSSA